MIENCSALVLYFKVTHLALSIGLAKPEVKDVRKTLE